MVKNIFVNLCVQDLNKSKAFFEKLGWHFNPQFTNEEGGCLVIHENIFAMLITPAKFQDFAKGRKVIDAHSSTEILTALSCESKAEVDEIFEKAVSAGGTKFRDTEDLGFMYTKSFADLDGHIWEMFWMDPSAIQ